MLKERPIHHQPTKPYTHPQVGESTQISNLQTELKYLNLFKCYNILAHLGVTPLGDRWGGWMGVCMGVGGWGCPMQAHMCMHA